MQTITVKTGYGYFRDRGECIVGKAQLPAGDHPMRDGYSYTEVAGKAELDLIEVWQDPNETKVDLERQIIRARVRQIAIADLIATGDLPAGYE